MKRIGFLDNSTALVMFITVVFFALVFSVFLTSCATAPVNSSTQPSTAEITDYSGQWIAGLIESFAKNGSQAANTLCQAGIMTEKECGYVALGQVLLPSFLGIAEAALGAFKQNPTAQNQTALQTAMEPVYSAAKKVNTP